MTCQKVLSFDRPGFTSTKVPTFCDEIRLRLLNQYPLSSSGDPPMFGDSLSEGDTTTFQRVNVFQDRRTSNHLVVIGGTCSVQVVSIKGWVRIATI